MTLSGRFGPPSALASTPQDTELRTTARHLTRRRLLTVTAAAAALAFTTDLPARGAFAAPRLDVARIREDPFTLGVSSGAPLPGSVLIWTRLAPAPFEPDGGLGQQRVEVSWEVALDESFILVVRSGTALAHPEYAHSVRVDVRGLDPGSHYYYRFRTGTWISPAGRTRSAPRPTTTRRACGWRRSPARRTTTATTPCTGTSRRRTSTWSSTSATTSTNTPSTPRAGPATTPTPCCRPHSTARRRPWRTTGCGTRSTRATPTCAPSTPRTRSSSPGTITRPRATTRAPSTRTAATRRRPRCRAAGARSGRGRRRPCPGRASGAWR